MDGAKERADATRDRPMVTTKHDFAAAMEMTQETVCAQHALAPCHRLVEKAIIDRWQLLEIAPRWQTSSGMSGSGSHEATAGSTT